MKNLVFKICCLFLFFFFSFSKGYSTNPTEEEPLKILTKEVLQPLSIVTKTWSEKSTEIVEKDSDKLKILISNDFISENEVEYLKKFLIKNNLHNKEENSLLLNLKCFDNFILSFKEFSKYRKSELSQKIILKHELLLLPSLYKHYANFLSSMTNTFFNFIHESSEFKNALGVYGGPSFDIQGSEVFNNLFGELVEVKEKQVSILFKKINQTMFYVFQVHKLIEGDVENNHYKVINAYQEFSSEKFKGALKKTEISKSLLDMIFYKEGQIIIPFVIPAITRQEKTFAMEYFYGPRLNLKKGSYFFTYDEAKIVEESGFIISKSNTNYIGINNGEYIIRGYFGYNTHLPFCGYGIQYTISANSQIYQWLKSLAEENEENFFIPFTFETGEEKIFKILLLQEIKEMLEELPADNGSSTQQEKIHLFIEALEPELLSTFSTSQESADQNDISQASGSQIDSPLIKEIENKIDAYTQQIMLEQEEVTRKVANNSYYESKVTSKDKKDKKTQKLKSIKKPSEQSKKLDNKEKNLSKHFIQNLQGASKFRKLTKLIGKMARDLPEDTVRQIITGSHINLHADNLKKQTLVRKTGGTSISLSTSKKIINNFLEFFEGTIKANIKVPAQKLME